MAGPGWVRVMVEFGTNFLLSGDGLGFWVMVLELSEGQKSKVT